MKSRLDRLESRLQAAIERHLPWGRSDNPLATAKKQIIAAALENQRNAEGSLQFPDDFILFLAPDRYASWQGQPDILVNLSEYIQQQAAAHQATFVQPPSLRLAAGSQLENDAMRVQAEFRPQSLEHTATLPLESESKDEPPEQVETLPIAAFLIVNGSQVVPLDQPVVNIGRRPDNTLVVDDGRVSRSHAQIRNIQGSYVLFDLNSTGGTYVNNERVAQCSLQPGDVISLAGVQLIYGEDAPSGSTHTGSTSQIKATPS